MTRFYLNSVSLAKSILILVLFVLCHYKSYAQPGNPQYSLSTSTLFEVDMHPIAILDIENSMGSTGFNFEISLPSESGANFGENPLLTNDDNWINYSCALRTALSRHISVNLSPGSEIPGGLELRLQVSHATGSAGGTPGTPAGGEVLLSASPQEIISGIQGSFTGNGPNKGHQLTYTLNIAENGFGDLSSGSTQINVIYTIMDN